jgi:hypothetical protein
MGDQAVKVKISHFVDPAGCDWTEPANESYRRGNAVEHRGVRYTVTKVKVDETVQRVELERIAVGARTREGR